MNSKMSLTYIANARFPTEKAHGLQIAKTIEALTRKHINVNLVIPKRRAFEKLSPGEFYDLSCEIKPIYLPCIDWFFLYKPFPRLGRFLYALETITFLFSVTIFGLIHLPATLFTRDPYLFVLLSFVRKNLFLELHTFPKTTAGKAVLRQILKRANGIVVTNRFLLKKVESEGVAEEKILVAPNGADLSLSEKMIPKLTARQQLGLPRNQHIVLYLGNFYVSKGVYVLLEAANNLSKNVKVVLVGGSEADRNIEPLKSVIVKNSLTQVTLIGFQERRRIPTYLSAADVCVLPNIVTDEESEFFTTPMKMLDYMAAKRPIVASDLPALREILGDESAVFVRPNDPQALAEGILRVLKDSIKANSRAKLAYFLAEGLSWDNRARRIKMFIGKSITHA